MNRKRSKRDEVADVIGCCAFAYTLMVLPVITGTVCVLRWLGLYGPCQGEKLLAGAVIVGVLSLWAAIIIKPLHGK